MSFISYNCWISRTACLVAADCWVAESWPCLSSFLACQAIRYPWRYVSARLLVVYVCPFEVLVSSSRFASMYCANFCVSLARIMLSSPMNCCDKNQAFCSSTGYWSEWAMSVPSMICAVRARMRSWRAGGVSILGDLF